MTAPTLNIAAPPAPGAKPAPSAGGAAPGGQLAGFEALLEALFPAVDPNVSGQTTPARAAAAQTPGKAAAEEDQADGEASALADGEAADPAAPAASLLVPAAAANETPASTAAAPPNDVETGGRLKAALQAANLPERAPSAPPPGLAKAAEVASEEVDSAENDLPPGLAAKAETPAGHSAAPPAFGRDKTAGAPAQPALENANPKADLAAKAADAQAADAADAPPPPAPPVEAAPAATAAEAAKLSPLATRPEAAPAKPEKSERKADAASPADGVKAAKPATAAAAQAKAAEAAAKPASEAIEAAPQDAEVEVEPDAPDAALPGETRAAGQSSAPAAHAAHAVRGSPETVATLAAQIVKKLEERATRFDLELDPAGLGRVDVRVEIGAHGKLTASMLFDNPQAAHELKARAAELQRALEQAGFDLSGGLSFQWSDNGRHQGQAWQDEGLIGRGANGRAFRAALETAGEAADAANHGALRLRRGVTAGVDVRI